MYIESLDIDCINVHWPWSNHYGCYFLQQELSKEVDIISKKYFATHDDADGALGPRVWQLMRDAQLRKIKDIRGKGFDKYV